MRRALLLLFCVPLLRRAAAADFDVTDTVTCGGECNLHKNGGDHGLRYAYMADVELDACQAKCDELECKCFDWSKKKPGGCKKCPRKGEKCRVCPTGVEEVTPFAKSNYGYNTHLRIGLAEVVSLEGGAGVSFLFIFSLLGCLYLSVGFANGTRKGLRGARAIPNYRLWVEVGGLVRDGVNVSRRRLTGRGGGMARGVGRAPLLAPDGGSSRGGSKEKSKLSKSKSKSQKQRRPPPPPPGATHRDGGGSDGAVAAPPPPTTAVAVEWQPTRSSAHLSSGARETGVKLM